MTASTYKYSIEQCDVHVESRKALQAYRDFRVKCLEYIRSDATTSIASQIHRLAWHTAIFKTLNEARKLEPNRKINGPMWELIGAGYTTLVTLGVRRLVDKDKYERVDSIWQVLNQIKKRPEMLSREFYVCYDGVPFDSAEAYAGYITDLQKSIAVSDDEEGDVVPISRNADWLNSQLLHKAFDRLCGHDPAKSRKRQDRIPVSVVDSMLAMLESPVIKRVCHLADRRFAHAERISPDKPIPPTTFNDVEEALRIIVRVTNFLSATVFYDAAFGTVVPTPQYDVLGNLDAPWISSELIPDLHNQWREVCKSMNSWIDDTNAGFFSEGLVAG